MSSNETATENTDRDLWRKTDPQTDLEVERVFITKGDGIGISVGGKVHVMPSRQWIKAADALRQSERGTND